LLKQMTKLSSQGTYLTTKTQQKLGTQAFYQIPC
jgi:hypothetical protein